MTSKRSQFCLPVDDDSARPEGDPGRRGHSYLASAPLQGLLIAPGLRTGCAALGCAVQILQPDGVVKLHRFDTIGLLQNPLAGLSSVRIDCMESEVLTQQLQIHAEAYKAPHNIINAILAEDTADGLLTTSAG
ncbi:hypothetical protein DIPPA_15839 [Diplonema papillatum]|nr:hypothetical protein DIPPA_15839 [Diplonema papillatum]